MAHERDDSPIPLITVTWDDAPRDRETACLLALSRT